MNLLLAAPEEKRYAELQWLALDYARSGETESLAAMLRHGLPVNLSDAGDNSLLMLACYHQHLATARMLLACGADVDRRNRRSQTPLGGAAFKGYADIVALLLDRGADIDADNGLGMTPLMFAAMFGRTQVVAQLQAHGASLKRRNRLGLSARFMVLLGRLATRWLYRFHLKLSPSKNPSPTVKL
jgi:ankyrin repeat protein